MLQHYYTWRCTLFRLIPHTQVIIWSTVSSCCEHIYSPLAGHILHSGSFWCLLPGLELRQVVPLFLLSDYLKTICNYYYYCYYYIRYHHHYYYYYYYYYKKNKTLFIDLKKKIDYLQIQEYEILK